MGEGRDKNGTDEASFAGRVEQQQLIRASQAIGVN